MFLNVRYVKETLFISYEYTHCIDLQTKKNEMGRVKVKVKEGFLKGKRKL